MQQLHLDKRPVQVAVKVQNVRLDARGIPFSKGRMHADIGHGDVRLPVRDDARDIHAERRCLHFLRQREVDRAEAERASHTAAMLHGARNGIRMAQELRGTLQIARRNLLPDIGRADNDVVNLHALHDVAADAEARAFLPQALRRALSAIAEPVVLSRDDPAGMELSDQHIVDKDAPVHIAHLRIKMAENDLIHATQLADFIPAARLRRDERHRLAGNHGIGVHIKCEHRGNRTVLLCALHGETHQRLVPAVYTVKISQRNGALCVFLYHDWLILFPRFCPGDI